MADEIFVFQKAKIPVACLQIVFAIEIISGTSLQSAFLQQYCNAFSTKTKSLIL
jgi:hypothetical protein